MLPHETEKIIYGKEWFGKKNISLHGVQSTILWRTISKIYKELKSWCQDSQLPLFGLDAILHVFKSLSHPVLFSSCCCHPTSTPISNLDGCKLPPGLWSHSLPFYLFPKGIVSFTDVRQIVLLDLEEIPGLSQHSGFVVVPSALLLYFRHLLQLIFQQCWSLRGSCRTPGMISLPTLLFQGKLLAPAGKSFKPWFRSDFSQCRLLQWIYLISQSTCLHAPHSWSVLLYVIHSFVSQYRLFHLLSILILNYDEKCFRFWTSFSDFQIFASA